MSGLSIGRRRRVYERKFDWAEARRRHAAGESTYALAREYGVHRSAVQRVIALPEHRVAEATAEQVAALSVLRADQVPCPRCERPMARSSSLCRDCHGETRLFAETTLVKTPGQKRAILRGLPVGRIVRVAGRWGVVCVGPPSRTVRLVDFWDGGREFVPVDTVVEVAPSTRVLIGGVEEPEEEIDA